jgi:phosphinothricin acetyltransferase
METTSLLIEPMDEADWPAVYTIYAEGIATGHATFALAPPPTWEQWCAGKVEGCSLVARAGPDGPVLGWAALSPTSNRAVYRGVGEVSLYVATAARGRGVGAALLRALVAASEAQGFWTLQAGIFPENDVSLHVHRGAGFRVVGRRERLGLMEGGPLAGCWRDVILMERRKAGDW